MQNHKHTESGLEINYTEVLKATINGDRGKYGQPESPNEEVYYYRVDNVELFDVEIYLDLKDEYEYHENMIEDVLENIREMIENTMQ